MARFLAGAACTALLTLLFASILGAKTYIPVSASNAGLVDAQQAATATPSAYVSVSYPSTDKAVDGPLAVDLTVALDAVTFGNGPYALHPTALLTYNGTPVASQVVVVSVTDSFNYASVQAGTGGSCRLATGCDMNPEAKTNAAGKLTTTYDINGYYRGHTVLFAATATYLGRSVQITRGTVLQ